MTRLRAVLTVLALLGASACGGGASESDAPIPEPALLELADACVKVNEAAQAYVGGTGMADPDQLSKFADAVDVIAVKTDERGRDAVSDLATRSREVSKTLATSRDRLARIESGIDMLNGYKRLQDSCQAVGSPLSVPD